MNKISHDSETLATGQQVITACAFIHQTFDSIEKVFLPKRAATKKFLPGVFELPGGHIDYAEDIVVGLKREVIEVMMNHGIYKFILIGENVLNFHTSDDSYYEEWFEDVNDADGWIALMNFRSHVLDDMKDANVDSYFVLGGQLNDIRWRTMNPDQLYESVTRYVVRRLAM